MDIGHGQNLLTRKTRAEWPPRRGSPSAGTSAVPTGAAPARAARSGHGPRTSLKTRDIHTHTHTLTNLLRLAMLHRARSTSSLLRSVGIVKYSQTSIGC